MFARTKPPNLTGGRSFREQKKIRMKQLKLFNRTQQQNSKGFILIGTATTKQWFRYRFIRIIENKNHNVIKNNSNETL